MVWPLCTLPDRSAQKAVPVGRAMNCMSAETGREFIDTTILVYAFDASAGSKQVAAGELLERLWHTGHGCLSVQVLQEFFVTVTRYSHRTLNYVVFPGFFNAVR